MIGVTYPGSVFVQRTGGIHYLFYRTSCSSKNRIKYHYFESEQDLMSLSPFFPHPSIPGNQCNNCNDWYLAERYVWVRGWCPTWYTTSSHALMRSFCICKAFCALSIFRTFSYSHCLKNTPCLCRLTRQPSSIRKWLRIILGV